MDNICFRITDVSHIVERHHAAGWNIEKVYYEDEYSMALILDGETEYWIGGKKYLVQKNDLIVFPPQLLRSGRTSSDHPWSFITVLFRMDLNESAQLFFNKSPHIWNQVNDSYRKLFAELHGSWLSKDPLFEVKCNLLVTEILYKLVLSDLPHQNMPHIEKLEKARMLIQENFRSELSVAKLAKSTGMSVSYFRRLFLEVYGYSPIQYIINLRIANARDLLLSREVNVTEAAQLSGFNDIYYFSRLFKKKTGTLPSSLLKDTIP